MKNRKEGFVGIIVIVFVALGAIAIGAYAYSSQKTPADVAYTPVSTPTTPDKLIAPTLPDDAFLATVGDSQAKILAKGDIDGDGYDDAIVQEVHCGASCSVSLQVVLNERNMTARLFKDKNYPDTFSPAYLSSSAAKSQVSSVIINNGIVSLTGKGLACFTLDSEKPCTEEKWNVIKTATYKFDGSNMIQLSVEP